MFYLTKALRVDEDAYSLQPQNQTDLENSKISRVLVQTSTTALWGFWKSHLQSVLFTYNVADDGNRILDREVQILPNAPRGESPVHNIYAGKGPESNKFITFITDRRITPPTKRTMTDHQYFLVEHDSRAVAVVDESNISLVVRSFIAGITSLCSSAAKTSNAGFRVTANFFVNTGSRIKRVAKSTFGSLKTFYHNYPTGFRRTFVATSIAVAGYVGYLLQQSGHVIQKFQKK